MIYKDISALLILKFFAAAITYYVMHFLLSEELFNYYDMADYMHCTPNEQSNVTNLLYRKFICVLGLNYMGSMSSLLAIAIASVLNSIIIACFYFLLSPFLSRNGQILLILFLAFHPYLAVYFPRLYSDIFGLLGILLISTYVIYDRKIDFYFILLTMILINLRGALIPAFFFFGFFYFVEIFRKEKIIDKNSLLLIVFVIMNFFVYKDFAESFMSFSFFSDDGVMQAVPKETPYFSSQYPYLNPILLLGFRESISNLGFNQLFIAGNSVGYFYLVCSLILVAFHSLGIYGLVNFSIRTNRLNLLSALSVIIIPLLAISHLRYLLPLMPILIFGVIWPFFKK